MTEDKLVRDKLVHQGAATLSVGELMGIVIGEGSGGMSATELAEAVLEKAGGSLGELARTDIRRMRQIAGLGVRKAAILGATLELGRRLAVEESARPAQITSNEDVERIFRPRIGDLPYEEFWVLYLSSANTVIDKARVSQGGVSGTVVDHRLVVKRAIELLASGIILVHNHPSGVAIPSGEDRALTESIVQAAALFDITVLDHLIICAGGCYSFRQEGLIG